MKLLLINPRFPESFWSFSWALEKVVKNKRALNSPLGLATLAGLTPKDWEITIIDENVEPIDWSAQADVVGVCGMGVQVPRQREILKHFRDKGCYVVAGGAYASLCPEEYEGLAHAVIAGEAENIWPQFCRDFSQGQPKALYQETGEIDLSTSPVPRFDLLKLDRYQKVSIQFSRGCPFRCEFCDIIVMFGRKPRTKPFEQVEKELDMLREQGVRNVFFVDDNLIGNLPQAKKLLAFLVDYQERYGFPFSFGTEASLNMADEPKLMSLFKKANFEWVFIGIESPSEESLQETLKTQNLRGDMLSSVRTIYSYGIDIMAGFIVGFDHDDKTIFERQYKFIMEAGIAVSMVGLLVALPKTPLFKRLVKDNRLRQLDAPDNTRPYTNIVPQQMSYEELVEGYQKLLERLRTNASIHHRLMNKLKYLKDPPTSPYYNWKEKLAYFFRLVFLGILPGGPSRIYYFFRSLFSGFRRPKGLPLILSDWIASISLKKFADRYSQVSSSQTETNLSFLHQQLVSRIAEPVERGWIALRLAAFENRTHIWIDLKQSLDPKEIRVLYRTLRTTLKDSKEAVVLDLHRLKESQLKQMELLLKKLRRYHEQVQVQITEALYPRLKEELRFFQYSLVTP